MKFVQIASQNRSVSHRPWPVLDNINDVRGVVALLDGDDVLEVPLQVESQALSSGL